MLRHFFQTAQRHLRKDWPYTLINVIGLTIGLSLVFFIILFVNREFSWNKTHEHRDNAYRMLVHTGALDWTQPLTPYPFGPAMKDELPDIQAFTRLSSARAEVVKEDGSILPIRLTGVDPGVFDIFSFKYLAGPGASQLLKSKDEVVLSKQYADGLFGDKDPIGQTLSCTGSVGEFNLVVTGVFDDFPATSTFRPQALFSVEWINTFYNFKNSETDWYSCFFELYFRLRDGADIDDFKQQLRGMEEKYFEPGWLYTLDIQKITDMYLHSGDLVNARTRQGDLKKIKIFSLVGILVLLIAAFNYVILASARTAARYREIGLRKVNGASRRSISTQIYGESVLTSLLAFPLSLLVVFLLIPKVNQVLGTQISFDPGEQPWLLPGFLGVCLFVGILSGAYLAVYLSRLRIVDILRSRSALSNTRSGLYKVLVTAQILIFIGMLSCSSIIFKQVRYAEKMDPGFDRENLFLVNIDMFKFTQWNAFAEELRSLSGVENAGVAMGGPPTEGRGVFSVPHLQDPELMVTIEGLSVGGYYPETMGFRLVSGRFFTPGAEEGENKPIIVNETALRELGVEGDPIGQDLGGSRVIGVISDFHVHSVKSRITPMFISMSTSYCYEVAVRIKSQQQEETISQIEAVYKRMGGPDVLFRIQSYDDALANVYHTERSFAKTLTGFTGLAIFIAVLGLFGLSLLLASRRTKEIGIRKVHGASVLNIMATINKSFTIYTGLAFVLSVPLSIWIMQNWLQNFVYRTTIGWVEFAGSGVIALFIVWLTVSYHAWRAARMNPAEAIRWE